MKKIYIAILLAGLLMAGTAGFSSAMTADEVLDKMDQTMEHSNQVAVLSMTLTDKKGIVQNREIKMFQKEGGKRLIKFLKPADVKGTGFLSLPGDEMYIYMPALGKVRRIASHVKNQSFMGTDFSYDDMEAKPYSEKYTPKLLKTEANVFVLELTPKSTSDYSKLIVNINKTNYYPESMEYYDKGNTKIKDAKYTFKKIGNYWNAQEIEMTDLKKNHKTKMQMSDVKYDQGLTDDDFTVRKLKQ